MRAISALPDTAAIKAVADVPPPPFAQVFITITKQEHIQLKMAAYAADVVHNLLKDLHVAVARVEYLNVADGHTPRLSLAVGLLFMMAADGQVEEEEVGQQHRITVNQYMGCR